ncbi:META domain-containing protein [Conexibacter woesei]|uniref:DUF306 domain-containing protein n=1 Tax=Conexibacter woesei (strain DSM 14684 / CCUG 47730 / CIP 108061 / JCM 11494 / NBRC 100937 / ID131577) TaxID=469383 RepID=D3F7G4_CONWI|nr:META domain-containing protein [Conexibacter woesei]ADB50826.1 protein of unknown function DUF306 Meta and HslJ [Conexibacter woesei DSM 14684]
MRQPIALAVSVVLVLAAALAGCGSSDDADGTTPRTGTGSGVGTGSAGAPEPAPTADALDGRSFVARAVRGRRLVHGSELTLSFEDGTLGARAGCNTLGAGYTVADGRLRLRGEPQRTMIGCAPALMRQDDWLSDFLAAGPTLALAGERLTLRGERATIGLTEGSSSGAPPPIVGTRWRLESIGDGATVSSVPAGVEPPTLRITKEGRAELFTGCNSGSAAATVRDDGFVVFDEFALTRKACAEPAADVEATVTAILDGEVAAGFEGAQLTLSKDGRRLSFAAG